VAAFIVAVYLFTPAIATGIVRGRAGESIVLKDCFAEIARDIYPLAAIAIISTFVSTAAMFAAEDYPVSYLLLIPGIYIQVVLSVVVPVRALERTSFVATFVAELCADEGLPLADIPPSLGLVDLLPGLRSPDLFYE
jgi:hypothetical protein